MVHQSDGDFLRKDRRATKNISIWEEDGSDIVEDDSGVEVRLLVACQIEVPTDTNTLLCEMLMNS
jgi:hypothetical protein